VLGVLAFVAGGERVVVTGGVPDGVLVRVETGVPEGVLGGDAPLDCDTLIEGKDDIVTGGEWVRDGVVVVAGVLLGVPPGVMDIEREGVFGGDKLIEAVGVPESAFTCTCTR
jgi:hypothetical protein